MRAQRQSGTVLHERAADDLRFIRATMERAGSFTAVPGVGGMLMGVSALVAAWLASTQTTAEGWRTVWLIELVVAVAIGAIAMWRKSVRVGVPLSGAVARRFALSFSAPVAAGAIVTAAMLGAGITVLLPAVWLACYGAAVIAGGMQSVLPIPLMGVGMMLFGGAAAAWPENGDLWLALGFGVLQIVVGIWIARRHGG